MNRWVKVVTAAKATPLTRPTIKHASKKALGTFPFNIPAPFQSE
jgi:hypothetical protein